MKRWDIINYLAKRNDAQSYLEIGVESGNCFLRIDVPHKISVDPDIRSNNPTYLMSSDEFFAQNEETFDLIFIDGLHESDQVKRDIENALECLNPDGAIVCHDIIPPWEDAQKVPRPQPPTIWTGDCWRAWLSLRESRRDLTMFVVESDYGCGIIEFGQQSLITTSKNMSYEKFAPRQTELLNIKPVSWFVQKLQNNEVF